MRDMKLRAWDGQKMITVSALYFHPTSSGKKACRVDDGITDQLCYAEDIMQWTGLYDKNNKPFFEGDIIKKDNLKNEGNYVVRYDLENASYDAFKPNQPDNWTFLSSDCEIIGNIYEHPNLIP